MSVTHIPARAITTCDSCGAVLSHENCRKRATLKLRHLGAELRHRDEPPPEDREMDLCDACDHAIGIAIDKTALACAAAINNPWPAPQPVEATPAK